MALERHSEEERSLVAELKAQGMNRRDRVAYVDALRAGDAAAEASQASGDHSAYAGTSKKYNPSAFALVVVPARG